MSQCKAPHLISFLVVSPGCKGRTDVTIRSSCMDLDFRRIGATQPKQSPDKILDAKHERHFKIPTRRSVFPGSRALAQDLQCNHLHHFLKSAFVRICFLWPVFEVSLNHSQGVGCARADRCTVFHPGSTGISSLNRP